MTVAELAQARQDRLIAINKTATNRVLRTWQKFDPNNLDSWWALAGPGIAEEATNAQLASVAGADRYSSAAAAQYDFATEPSAIVPRSLVGVDGLGRPVGGLLFGAVTATKTATASGMGVQQAFETGAAYLAAMMKTVVADAARRGDAVSASGKGFTHYVRVVNPGACARCAVLSGISSYKVAFKRHPACRCTSAPVVDDNTELPKGLHDNIDSYFGSLSPAEQDRVFTKSGAEAIRMGADPSQVVSARRGATGITTSRGVGRGTKPNSGRRMQKTVIGFNPDGTPVQVYTTSEGTTRRGIFGKTQRQMGTPGRIRLMPEEVFSVAQSPAEARVLLRDAGYLTTPGLTVQQAAEQAITDRKLADRLYGRAGYFLG